MRDRHTDTRPQGLVRLGLLVALLVTSAVPAAGRGGRGGGHGHHGGRHGHHGFRHGGHGFLGPGFGVAIWPYWDPYLDPYGIPPVVVAPSPQLYIQPALPGAVQPSSPQPTWYACDHPQGYYPYVPECPSGWRPVTPTPP